MPVNPDVPEGGVAVSLDKYRYGIYSQLLDKNPVMHYVGAIPLVVRDVNR
jgi:hypothetical protein